MRTDLLRVIDAAYRMELDEEQWLHQVAAETRAAFPTALGVAAWTFREGDVASRVRSVAVGLSPTHMGALTALAPLLATVRHRGLHGGLWSVAGSHAVSRALPAWRTLDGLGVRDVLVATHADDEGDGVAFAWCMRRRSPLSRPLATRWGWVLRQLVRARAVRRLLAVQPAVQEGAPGPTLELPSADAEGGSTPEADREARRLAALTTEQTEQLRGGGHDTALAAWRGLLDGRFAIVDRFESGARRYLVARAVGAPSSRALKLGEVDGKILQLRATGISLKVIASDLGLSVSAVSRRLARAMGALALRTPCELAELFTRRAVNEDA